MYSSRFLTNKCFLVASGILIVALLSLFIASAVLFRPQLSLSPYTADECRLDGAIGTNKLEILGPAVVLLPILIRLCESKTLTFLVNQITVNWKTSKTLSANELIEGRYHIIWSRPEILKGVLHNVEYFYQPLWIYPDYPVYWLSNEEIAEFDVNFLAKQRIGLLSDHSSYSGYQLPIASMQMLGLKLSDMHITFFADRVSLAEAAAKGDISLYPSVLTDEEGKIAEHSDKGSFDALGVEVPELHRFKMSGSSNGGIFYLHKSMYEHRCELQAQLGAAISLSILRKVSLQCPD